MIKILDLNFQGVPETIAAFLMETSEGLVLFESGPHSSIANLETALAEHNYKLSDIKHLFLTHIHFDHAGGAWALAQNGTQVYVHPRGYKHLLDPERLYSSAKRIYGDAMDMLWGKMEAIPANLLHEVQDREVFRIGEHEIEALHTPGHASHHIAWKIGKVLIAGDVAGCKIGRGPVVPPCPPPDIDIELWVKSIEMIRRAKIEKMFLVHFGEVSEINSHLDHLEATLWSWAAFMKPFFENKTPIHKIIPDFGDFADQQLRDAGVSDDSLLEKYATANPSFMSVAGLMRYWEKKEK